MPIRFSKVEKALKFLIQYNNVYKGIKVDQKRMRFYEQKNFIFTFRNAADLQNDTGKESPIYNTFWFTCCENEFMVSTDDIEIEMGPTQVGLEDNNNNSGMGRFFSAIV